MKKKKNTYNNIIVNFTYFHTRIIQMKIQENKFYSLLMLVL